eukprot:gnl/TRDRNA2_/TRDRNA2_138084_c1_seq1.p1 gnl/TRDRNA2_/TRDRNA2_138084_c1~~gnl/TRDRNA2_/TRDRNA2_138084_c1_seq1.p1  ORF type:complete len:135 (-),score=25.91 gnl/TRDRNA2_/TRDRNA2_138084_c1_seq1:337-741(-)
MKEKYVNDIIGLFRTIDSDSSGGISVEEFQAAIDEPAVSDYFAALEIDPLDALTLFKLLDYDGGGVIEASEFVDGCMRLKGQARSIDMALALYESRWIRERLTNFIDYVKLEFEALHAADEVHAVSPMPAKQIT